MSAHTSGAGYVLLKVLLDAGLVGPFVTVRGSIWREKNGPDSRLDLLTVR